MISKTKKFNLGTLILTTYLQMTPVSTANRYDYCLEKETKSSIQKINHIDHSALLRGSTGKKWH